MPHEIRNLTANTVFIGRYVLPPKGSTRVEDLAEFGFSDEQIRAIQGGGVCSITPIPSTQCVEITL